MPRDFTINLNKNYIYKENIGNALGPQDVHGGVYCLYSGSGGLYAGGSFAGYFNRVARWDSEKWNKIDNGLFSYIDSTLNRTSINIRTITQFKNKIYAAGLINISHTISQFNWRAVAYEFDGETWTPIIYEDAPEETTLATSMLISDDKYLYLAGFYGYEDGKNHTLLRWDGESIERIDDGDFYEIFTLLSHSSGIYCGGSGVETNIKKYDGTNWTNLPVLESANVEIQSMGYISDKIYACPWNGQIKILEDETWNSLGELTGIYSFISGAEGIYAAGQFEDNKCLSLWNGASWNTFEQKISNYSSFIKSIISCSDGIYVANGLGNGEALSGSSISRWDGTNWNSVYKDSDLYRGLYLYGEYACYDLVSSSEGLYNIGNFSEGIRLWDGEKYVNIGSIYPNNLFSSRNAFSSSEGLYLRSKVTGSDEHSAVFCIWDGISWKNITGSFQNDILDPYCNTFVSGADGVYSIITVHDTPYSYNEKMYKWDGQEFSELFTMNNFYSYSSTIKSGSNSFYLSDSTNLIKWDGITTSSIPFPRFPEVLTYTDNSNIEIGENDKLYGVYYQYLPESSIIEKWTVYSLSQSSWTAEIELPVSYSYYGGWSNRYSLVGSGSKGLYIASENIYYFSEQEINPNSHSLYLFDGVNLNKIIDSNGKILKVIEGQEGIYACGFFDRQGYKIMLIKEFTSGQIKPIIFNTNNVITMKKPTAYKVSVG